MNSRVTKVSCVLASLTAAILATSLLSGCGAQSDMEAALPANDAEIRSAAKVAVTASVSPTTAAANQEVVVVLTVTTQRATFANVTLRVLNPDGSISYTAAWPNQNLVVGTPLILQEAIAIDANDPPGTYSIGANVQRTGSTAALFDAVGLGSFSVTTTAAPDAVCATAAEGTIATLSCPSGQTINAIGFATYGNSTGSCGAFATGSCNATSSMSVVQSACLNKASCTVSANNDTFGDPCVGTPKRLDVQVTCGTSTCVPSCSGKVCGSDGCGGTCGSCGSGQSCSAAGQCVSSCAPSCSGKVCGSDGCGGTCGSCGSGQSCSAGGQCVTGTTTLSGWQLTPSNIGLAPHGLTCSELPVYSGPSEVPSGTTISGKRITVQLYVSAGNIVIEKSCIQPTSAVNGLIEGYYPQGDVTIRDSEFDGSLLSPAEVETVCAFTGGANLIRNYIHDVGSGICMVSSTNTRDFGETPKNILIENNFVHKLVHYSDAHHEAATVRDFVQNASNTRTMKWVGNYLDSDCVWVSGGLFLQPTFEPFHNLWMEGNVFAGNGFNLWITASGCCTYSNVHAVNNRFKAGTIEYYGPVYTEGPGWDEWRDNYLFDGSQPDARGAIVNWP